MTGFFGAHYSGWRWFALLMTLVFSLPTLALIVIASGAEAGIWQHLSATVLPAYLKNTLWLMLGVGFGVFVFGVGTGWLTAFYEFPGRRVVEWALMLPMAFPAYILAMVYLELLDYSGAVQSGMRQLFGWSSPGEYWFPQIASLGGAVLMLSLVLYPYVYLLARSAFQQQAAVLLEASRMLGDRSRVGFWKVALPLARPSIAVGLSLALMETLADFGTVQLFAVPTFTTGIYHTWFGASNPAGAAQLSLSLLAFVAALIVLERVSRNKQRYHGRNTSHTVHPRKPLHGITALGVQGFCLLPVFFGFLLPTVILLQWSWHSRADLRLSRFLTDSGNSLLLASLTALLAISLAVLLGYGVRIGKGTGMRTAAKLVSLGYAFPGPVIALGVLMPLAWMDRHLNGWSDSLGWTSGYWLSGTLFILLYAYLVRFLALAYGTVSSGLTRITPGLEDSSRLLGRTPRNTLRNVHVPLLRGSLLTAAMLVFVDVMKELPATLMLQPFNFSTLATRAYGYASEELQRESALWCLAIVFIGLMPVIMLNRHLRLSRHFRDTSHRLMPVTAETAPAVA